jgi:putative glutamine amidotransferase
VKPVIGITPSPLADDRAWVTGERYALSSTYVLAVLAAGGVPVILPPQAGNERELLDRLDGVLFSGGADIAPERFGDTEIHPATYDVHPLRDQFEIDLIREVRRRDLPTLCICRGIQLLNVAFGGTLYQDVPDQFSTDLHHRQQAIDVPADEPSHAVMLEGDAAIRARLGYPGETVQTNSFHHQAVKEIGEGLVVAGRTDDGLIEALVAPDQRFMVGVQWHPEMMFQRHTEHLGPFVQLVEAARAARLTATAG